jgi:hypothetical protein
MTADYEMLVPDDEGTVLAAISKSISMKFLDDPVSALKSAAKKMAGRPPKL